jgi:cytochrome c peroxidase
LPVFTLQCGGNTYVVTDPGRALISGNCDDIGKFKGPILRGLAARAPYFHNGSAATLLDVVNFYNQRFGIGFTDQQKKDLVNFLKTL